MDDRELWWAANSALWAGRITEERIERFRKRMPPVEFAREFLSWWEDPLSQGGAFDPLCWAGLADPQAERGKAVLFALDVAPDHSSASVSVAWKRPDERAQVMLAHHQRGVDGLAARCTDLLGSWGGRLVVEKTGTAAFLLPDLESLSVELVPRQFFVDSCAHLDATVTASGLRHGNQAELNAAVESASWLSSSTTGARVLNRKDPRVSPLVAAGLALFAVSATAPPREFWGAIG